ncbi:MAG: glycosyltransferase [Myxococcales bacterium]|nr:glycosyltransferase [Myxococcota bacterium]MDW8280196.1 glycosyltransferase [Myxococcales bacterium]
MTTTPTVPLHREAGPFAAGVSACLIVRNEEELLPECLASLRPWVEQICVLDTGSTDRTVAIAQSFGATVAHAPWQDDFAAARNASLALARHDWILVLDADETLDSATGPALRAVVQDGTAQAFVVMQEAVLSDGSVRSQPVVRLFRNRPEIYFSRPVHEDVMDSLFALGLRSAANSGVRILNRGHSPERVKARDRAGRNLALLRRRVQEAPEDLYSTWKLAVSLDQPEQATERHQALHAACALADRLPAQQRQDHPYLPLLYAGLGQCLCQRGELGEAIRTVERGMALFPDNLVLVFHRGDLLRRIGETEAAARCLRQCLGASPRPGAAGADAVVPGVLPAIGLGLLALEAGNLDAATSMAGLALRFDPNHIEARCLRVRTLVAGQQFQEAMAELDRLVATSPTAPAVQLLGGELAWLQGDRELAVDLWRKALGPTDTGNDARAQLAIGELVSGSRAAALLHLTDLAARDVPTAACRLILELMGRGRVHLDAAFRPEAVLRHVRFWLREIAAAGRRDVLQSLAQAAPAAEAALPGICSLLRENGV